MTEIAPVKARTSQFASALLQLKGKPLSFEHYRPFELIYDIDPDMMVLKAGRQIGKSVSLGGRIATKSIARSYFNSLYLAPLQIQSKRFSKAYLDAFINSTLIKKHFKNTTTTKNVYEKSFNNGSTVYLSYAENENDADRIRGIMADQLTLDEVQDISYDALPPIFEILSASPYQFKVMAGTSKSTSNTLEHLWLQTNQLEWCIKCTHCGHWVVPNDYDVCIKICSKPEGPSCDKCGSMIDVGTGQWVSGVPTQKRRIGFHLPQFIMGANTTPKKWMGLWEKVQGSEGGGLYSPAKLSNEVFGLATDLAGKSISMREAQECCNNEMREWYPAWPRNKGIVTCVMGIDWAVTGAEKSFTVASVLGYDAMGKCFLLYSEKFHGVHPLKQVERIQEIFHKYRCQFIGSDRGVGVLQGQLLQQALGPTKLMMINYVSSKARLRYDIKNSYLAADRTQAIDNVIMKIRYGRDRFETPSWDLTSNYWRDGLSIYEEETLSGNRVYRHHPDEPDDWLHSIVFGNIAYQYLNRDFTFTE
jgi:hypothetical protein